MAAMVAQARFTLAARRDLHGAGFEWPAAPEQDELEGNHFYQDLRLISWDQVDAAIALERGLLKIFEDAPTEDAARQAIDSCLANAHNSDPLLAPLCDLDIGVASCVMALSAADCIPFTSCNGGALGGLHSSSYPVVAFFMRPAHAPILLACAERARIGLKPYETGRFQAYADDLYKLIHFACELRAKADSLRAIID
ncbi:hypothetical protein [Vitreimonas sp.]|uniref:hypothetical protein n=1 Tax=Vitreimonas sp. TaxID=3069702 RepID=UPI002ED886DC